MSAAATAPPGTAMSHRLVVVLLGLLLGIQPITTDIYLPGMPAMRAELAAPMAQVQLTLTGLLLAFGASQLLWGPLSDRFGRRPILLTGLALYTVAGALCAMAQHMADLVWWRTVQGAAMGAAVMAARAIVRDVYEPAQGARVMAMALGGLGVIAGLGPPLGGLLVSTLGWRAALVAVTLCGAALWLTIALRFTETLPPARRSALRAAVLGANLRHALGHRTFWAWALLVTASYAGLFTFLAASSFVFVQVWGFGQLAYGFAVSFASVVYVSGTLLCRRLLTRMEPARAVRHGAWLSLASSACMALMAITQWHPWWAFLAAHALFMFGHGIHQPCAQSGVVAPFAKMAGLASALSGFIMMVAAFGVGLWLGWRLDATPQALLQGISFWGAAIAAIAWTLVRWWGHAPATQPAPEARA
jgi:MFS transporter, DHA1 family, multidrug resistance protein